MEWLQSLIDSSTTPVLTAFLLGLLTSLSPCPLATNIAAIGYISKILDDRRKIFHNGLFYTSGRVLAYTILGVTLIAILKGGSSLFGIQKFIGKYGELILPPVLVLMGLLMLFGDRLKLPSFGFSGNGESLLKHGGLGSFILGVLFAMAFCPSSGIFYFGMLIPMSATSSMGYILPVLYAIGTALPVLIVAWVLAYSAGQIGKVYGKMQTIQKWMNLLVGILFILIGIYYCIIIYL